jgi:hypothetical protein
VQIERQGHEREQLGDEIALGRRQRQRNDAVLEDVERQDGFRNGQRLRMKMGAITSAAAGWSRDPGSTPAETVERKRSAQVSADINILKHGLLCGSFHSTFCR